jgi:hypothetical protein
MLRLPAFTWLRGAHDDAVHGARRYTASDVRSLCARAGLTLARTTYLNALLLPVAFARRSFERLTGVGEDDLGPTPRLADAVGRIAMTVERSLLRRWDLPVGVSIMAVARRAESEDSRQGMRENI